MPDEVHEALSRVSSSYIALAKEGRKGPSVKDIRMASLLGRIDFTIIDGVVINHRAKQ